MRKQSAERAIRSLVPLAALAALACNRETPAPAAAHPNPPAPTQAAPVRAPVDPKLQRWQGVTLPTARWDANVATDVLLRAEAPGLDAEAVDARARPMAAALRALPGVEVAVTRARPGELRAVVRFAPSALKGPAAADVVLGAWQAAPPAGLAAPVIEPIARGARASAALEMLALGGRIEATRYVDAHVDALVQAARGTTRSHVAGAVRPVIALRVAPTALASHGIAFGDVVDAAQAWLAKPTTGAPPELEAVRNAVHDIKLERHWTATGEKLAPAPMDRLVDVSVEQGEPTREARNGHTPTTFWLVDAPPSAEVREIEGGMRKVAAESKEVFRPTTQTLSAAARLVISVPEGKEPESLDALSQRLLALRTSNEALVAVNAIGGHDGVPESLDVDGRDGRAWTVWLSIASPESGAVLFAVREALLAGGWDVHVLSDRADPALSWVLDAWGAGGALVSADDPGQLAPTLSQLAQRAQKGQGKADMRQGPRPTLAPTAFRRVDPKQLMNAHLPPQAAQQFVLALDGMQPMGWWYETPVWLGLPVGDLAATIGQTPLNWQGTAGSGPTHGWLASDVLRLADTTPGLDLVRVNGRPALWAVCEDISDAPQAVAGSFWNLVEAHVDMRAGMRVEPLDVREHPLAVDAAPPTP